MNRTSVKELWIAAGLVLLVSMSAPAGPGLMAPEILNVELPADTGPLIIRSASVHLESAWTPPAVRPAAPAADAWRHDQRSQSPCVLAGHPGQLTTDIYVTKGLRLAREAWLDNEGCSFAVRLRLRNIGTEPLQLDRLVPLACSEAAAGDLFKTPPENWTFLIQQRQKNEQARFSLSAPRRNRALRSSVRHPRGKRTRRSRNTRRVHQSTWVFVEYLHPEPQQRPKRTVCR